MAKTKVSRGAMTLAEMKEFATFPAATQRYIRRSLEVAAGSEDAVEKWSRDVGETASIRAQARIYMRIEQVRGAVPEAAGLEGIEPMLVPLTTLAAFDLGQGRLPTFSAFRFLYERLLGAGVRPWLPSVFCSAAAMPHLNPDLRRRLLQSISEGAATAAGWSNREPTFVPAWVDKIEDMPRAA